MPDPDIDEIFSHIKQIIREKKQSEDVTGDEEVNEDVQDISKMKVETDEIESNVASDIAESDIESTPELDENVEENVSKMKAETEVITPEDISNVAEPEEETTAENDLNIGQGNFEMLETTTQVAKLIPPWRWGDNSTGICDLCGHEMEFEKNLSGLVISDKFFACEECCKTASKEDLVSWTESKMVKPNDVRPIGLWTIQEKNKNKSILFRK